VDISHKWSYTVYGLCDWVLEGLSIMFSTNYLLLFFVKNSRETAPHTHTNFRQTIPGDIQKHSGQLWLKEQGKVPSHFLTLASEGPKEHSRICSWN
jgi:hypothetical protein